MTVFISIPWFLPAYKAGGPIQSVANLIRNFPENIQYKVFCSNADLDGKALGNIQTDQWVSFNDNTDIWYASDNVSKNITTEAEKLKPDVIFIIGIFSWHYNLVPLFFCKAPLKILSVRGMLHDGALAQKRIKKRLFLSAMRFTGISKKTIFHATDETEAAFVRKAFGEKINVIVANNYGRQIKLLPAPQKKPGILKLTTIALISPMKNHLVVLQALSKSKCKVEYDIYGPVKDAAYWQLCLRQIALLPENITVKYHGEADPSSVESILAAHHVFIMPSESENFGHSIFESLSAGRPVITGNNTPWNGLSAAHAGSNVIVSEEDILTAISFFAEMNNETYLSFVKGAATYISERTDKNFIDAQYRELFNIKNDAEG